MELRQIMQRELKALPASLSNVAENGIFEGYACLFGKKDLGQDIVRSGAFTNSLATRGMSGVKLLYQHDPNQPVGQWLTIKEDHKGLFVRGQLALEVAKAREIHAMMKAGILDGLSIGFRTTKAHKDAKSGLRYLAEVDLWEISIVTFPMQPDARIRTVKSIDRGEDLTGVDKRQFQKRRLERKLTQDAGLSRSEARALLAHGMSGLTGKQDAAHIGANLCLDKLCQLTESVKLATSSISRR